MTELESSASEPSRPWRLTQFSLLAAVAVVLCLVGIYLSRDSLALVLLIALIPLPVASLLFWQCIHEALERLAWKPTIMRFGSDRIRSGAGLMVIPPPKALARYRAAGLLVMTALVARQAILDFLCFAPFFAVALYFFTREIGGNPFTLVLSAVILVVGAGGLGLAIYSLPIWAYSLMRRRPSDPALPSKRV